MADSKEVILIDLKVEGDDSIDKAVNSIGNLEKANKALREERKKLNLDTAEGKKRVSEINESINKNTDTIKANSDTLKKNQLNVGNYTESINQSKVANQNALAGVDKMSGGLIGQAKAIKTTYLAMGPLGLIIGAIGLAVGALTAYFKGSEEGQDKLAKVMAVGKVVFDSVLVVVEKLGEALFSIGEVIASGVGSVIDFFAPKVGKMLSDTIKSGAAIADLLDTIEANENALIVKRAETNRKVSELREKAIQSEGDQKRAFVEEAIKLEKQLAAEELKQANLKLSHFEREAKSSGRLTEEQKKQRAELTAAIIEKEAQAFDATRKFQKELEKLKDEETKKNQEQLKLNSEQEAIDRANRHAKSREANEIEIEDLTTHNETKLELQATFEEAVKISTQSISDAVKEGNEKQKISDLETYQARIKGAQETVDIAAGLAQGLTTTILAQYALEENALKVKLANELTAINSTFSTEKASLDAQLAAKTISQAQYDAGILSANQKLQANTKAAQVKQAVDLNAIKKKQFEADKKNQIAQALADTAQAVLSVFAQAKGGPVLKGIAAGAAAIFAAIRVNQIRQTQFVPTTFARGGKVGTFSGPSHARGGIDFVGSNGQRINVEGGENFYVLKKSASDQINRLSALNESHGGRPFYMGRQPASRLADGGLAASGGGISVRDFNNLVNKINSIQIVMPVEELDIVQERRAIVTEKGNLA